MDTVTLRGPGQPPYATTDEGRALVTRLKLTGMPNATIAEVLDISLPTLKKNYDRELRLAKAELNGNIAAAIYHKAMQGDATCLIFWAKTQMGWRETERKEITGPDGAPLSLPAITLEFVGATDGKPTEANFVQEQTPQPA